MDWVFGKKDKPQMWHGMESAILKRKGSGLFNMLRLRPLVSQNKLVDNRIS
jgi:hypothetical protein